MRTSFVLVVEPHKQACSEARDDDDCCDHCCHIYLPPFFTFSL